MVQVNCWLAYRLTTINSEKGKTKSHKKGYCGIRERGNEKEEENNQKGRKLGREKIERDQERSRYIAPN